MVITPLQDLQADLAKVEANLINIIQTRGRSLRSTTEGVFRSGGKRLRPALVLLTGRLFPQNEAGLVAVATAVEMIHGASLLHDDVLDGTHTRRGLPTVNSTQGDRYSVLLGDFLLCQALLVIAELGDVELLQVISQAVADMTEGQILEAKLQGCVDTPADDYLRIVEGKTAALMAAGCRMAALVCGAPREQVEAVTVFGRELGLSFQIVDDVLDFWGDPEVLGKPTGSDIREKKFTLPFLDAYGRAHPEEQLWVDQLVNNGSLDNGGLRELMDWMEQHQAQERSLGTARRHTEAAQLALEALPDSAAKASLKELLTYVTERNR